MYLNSWVSALVVLGGAITFIIAIFSDLTLFLIVSYIAFGLYALAKLADDKTVLNWFRLSIIGYALCNIGFNPDFKLGISICAFIAFILCPISAVDRNKMTLSVLWQASSVGAIAGVIAVFTVFGEKSYDRVDVWIFGHYVFWGITYLICYLLARPKAKNMEIAASLENNSNAQLTSKSDSLLLPIFSIIGIIIAVSLIYILSNTNDTTTYKYSYSTAEDRKGTNVQVQKEQELQDKVEEKTDWVYLLTSQGKYGRFSTYLHKGTIKSDESFFGATILDLYNKCTEKMPYCEKYRRIIFDCNTKVFFVAQELTEKDGKVVKKIENDSEKAPIRKISESKIITSVFNEVCRSYLEQQKRIVQQKEITPTPSYTTQYSKPSYSTPYSGYKAVCRDGTYSYSRGRGTCSHHGGVAYYR